MGKILNTLIAVGAAVALERGTRSYRKRISNKLEKALDERSDRADVTPLEPVSNTSPASAA